MENKGFVVAISSNERKIRRGEISKRIRDKTYFDLSMDHIRMRQALEEIRSQQKAVVGKHYRGDPVWKMANRAIS